MLLFWVGARVGGAGWVGWGGEEGGGRCELGMGRECPLNYAKLL
jgi:hypothetical protein